MEIKMTVCEKYGSEAHPHQNVINVGKVFAQEPCHAVEWKNSIVFRNPLHPEYQHVNINPIAWISTIFTWYHPYIFKQTFTHFYPVQYDHRVYGDAVRKRNIHTYNMYIKLLTLNRICVYVCDWMSYCNIAMPYRPYGHKILCQNIIHYFYC